MSTSAIKYCLQLPAEKGWVDVEVFDTFEEARAAFLKYKKEHPIYDTTKLRVVGRQMYVQWMLGYDEDFHEYDQW